jgi:hypothetical protein
VDDVGGTDKLGDKGLARMKIDLARRPLLYDDAVAHQRDAVGHCQRLALVVRDIDRGHIQQLGELSQLHTHLVAQLGIQVAQRFVKQQQPRLMDQGAGQRDTLLLAA